MNRKQIYDINLIVKMVQGNPGAMACLAELDKTAPQCIQLLDRFEIYGWHIYVLWSDICGRDTSKMISLIMAAQSGLLDQNTLKDAASRDDYSGKRLIDVEGIHEHARPAGLI